MLSEIRALLLAEHERIRELAHTASIEAQRLIDGESHGLEPLRDRIGALDELVEAHNRHEEAELRTVIRDIDAWGRIRESLMDGRHGSEHHALGDSLRCCARVAQPLEAAHKALAVVAQLLEHLRREECELLAEDVLRDDLVTVQGFAG